MGLAAGGRIEQKIYPDPHGWETWEPQAAAQLRVHLLNSEQFRAITGHDPPPTPISARTYAEHGLPWFALYDQDLGDVATSERLVGLKSLAELEAEQGTPPSGEEEVPQIPDHQIVRLNPGSSSETGS